VTTTAEPRRAQPQRPAGDLQSVFVFGGVVLVLVAGQLFTGGKSPFVWALALVLLPFLFAQRPELGPVVLLVCGLAIEQFGYTVGPRSGAVTSKIPLFHGIGSFHVNAADLILIVLLIVAASKRSTGEARPWPRTPLAKSIYILFGFVVLGILVGKMHGGQLRYAFTETRPFVYLLLTFVLAYSLLTTRWAIRALFWALVATEAFKSIQGVLLFTEVRHYAIRPDAVLGHEEGVFFGLFVLMTMALWIFDVPMGRLRKTATWLTPLVLAADLANTRRAAWLVLAGGMITLLAVAYRTLPQRRGLVRKLAIVIGVGLMIYLPAYWNKSGGLAQPARAIHSVIKPSNRDASSDLYRIQEDANLQINIREGKPLGRGFGVPIDYVLPIQDISSIDPLIKYIPHNGILYILMRMGFLGGIAFWSMLGIAIISACRLARSRDRELAMIGALTAALVVAYVFEGATDQGFFYYRVAFVIGTFLGLSEAARCFDRELPIQTVSVAAEEAR
jgi:O-antigen ligase/polysaccharide polymerase Wzy-like membrane protein